jgi:hypothetical protein
MIGLEPGIIYVGNIARTYNEYEIVLAKMDV